MAEKALAMLKEGHKRLWGSFNTGAFNNTERVCKKFLPLKMGGGGCKQFYPVLGGGGRKHKSYPFSPIV